MSQEDFRQWIVILLAVAILTSWVNIGIKYNTFKCRMPMGKMSKGMMGTCCPSQK